MIEGLHPYSEYKESGELWFKRIPAHWQSARLKSRLARNDTGVWSDSAGETGTVVLRSTEQTVDGRWKIENPAKLQLTAKQRASATLEVGDLVVTKSSGSPLHIGKTSLVNKEIAQLGCCYSNFMQRLRVRADTSPELVWRLLNSAVGRDQFVFHTTTTTGLGNLNGTILGLCRFPFPPPDEQAAIVRFLDHANRKIDGFIRAKRKLIGLLNEQKQAIIHRAVTRGLDPHAHLKPSGIPWLGDIPKHWEARRAKYLFREVDERSKTGSEELLSVSHITGVTPRSQKNVTMFKAESNVGYKTCRVGDLAINTMWAWMAALGVSKHEGIISPAYAVYRQRKPERLGGDYADMLLRTTTYKANYIVRSTGVRASRLRLYPEQFFRIPILLPPTKEQEDIVAFIGGETASLNTAIARTEREIALMQEYRTRLTADVVTGKLDVRPAAAHLPALAPSAAEPAAEEAEVETEPEEAEA